MGKRVLSLDRSEWWFWCKWVLASTLAATAGLSIPWTTAFLLFLAWDGKMGWAMMVVSWVVTIAALAAATVTPQWLVLRKRLPRSGWWVLATAIGLAGLVVRPWDQAHRAFPAVVIWATPGFTLGTAQWLVLRKRVRRSGWWILASTGAIFAWSFTFGLAETVHPIMWIVLGAISWIEYGAITGMALVLLLRQPIAQIGEGGAQGSVLPSDSPLDSDRETELPQPPAGEKAQRSHTRAPSPPQRRRWLYCLVAVPLAILALILLVVAGRACRRSSKQEEAMTLSGHRDAVVHAAWDPSGTRIVTSSRDHTAVVWDVSATASGDNGVVLHTLAGHRHDVSHAAWDPSGTRIVTSSVDDTAMVWDAENGQRLYTLAGHSSIVAHAAWDGSGTRIVTSSLDKTAVVWDAESGQALRTLAGHSAHVQQAAWDPSDTRIVTASGDGTAVVWDASTGVALYTLTGHRDTVDTAAWDPSGTRILTADWDGTAMVWDAESGKRLLTLAGRHRYVMHAAWNPSGTRIVTAGWDDAPVVWDVRSAASSDAGVALFPLTVSGSETDYAAWDPSGTRIATASNDGRSTVWDASSGKKLYTFPGYRDRCPSGRNCHITHVAWDPSGTRIVATSADGKARVWDVPSGGD